MRWTCSNKVRKGVRFLLSTKKEWTIYRHWTCTMHDNTCMYTVHGSVLLVGYMAAYQVSTLGKKKCKSWKATIDTESGSQRRHFFTSLGLIVSWLSAVAYRIGIHVTLSTGAREFVIVKPGSQYDAGASIASGVILWTSPAASASVASAHRRWNRNKF